VRDAPGKLRGARCQRRTLHPHQACNPRGQEDRES